MTVCIAALSGSYIICVADRMKTAGDIQYEPPSPKIFQITNAVAIMTAGNATFQAEILGDLYKAVGEVLQKKPANWLEVKGIAELYIECRNAARSKRAERQVLTPLGLTLDTFVARQREMDSDLVATISRELMNFEVPTVASIVIGNDEVGTRGHIYAVQDGELSYWNTIGFASIGIGKRHADSQLMMAKYSPLISLTDALLLAYTAKKRSEVSPGVGSGTDIWMLGPNPGNMVTLSTNTDLMKKLESEYARISRKEDRALKVARAEIANFVDAASKKSAESAAKPQEIPQASTAISDVSFSTKAS